MSLSENLLALTKRIANEIKNKAGKSELPTTMVGADAVTNGASGLVPAPKITDANKFLKGDGTWAPVSVNTIAVTGINKWSTDPVTYFNSIYSGTKTTTQAQSNNTIGLATIGIIND